MIATTPYKYGRQNGYIAISGCRSVSQSPEDTVFDLAELDVVDNSRLAVVIASEDVVIQLLKSKCIPILLYALEVYNLPKSDLQSLDFSVNRFFMKLFRTSDMSVVNYCQLMFHVDLPSVVIEKRMEKFEATL